MRKKWITYFLELAYSVAERSTCDRAHVGCVLTLNSRILTTGYNGSLPGEQHCDDVGHYLENDHCVRTVHAEANAVAQAARYGTSLDGAIAYVTHRPCRTCYFLLRSAGVRHIYYCEDHGHNDWPYCEQVIL